MRVAVIADIHANHAALEACIAHAQHAGADAFWFLGDYLGELARPELTMALLYDLAERVPCVFIRGNKEDRWLAAQAQGHDWRMGSSTTGALRYTFDRLTERDFRFFAALPISQRIALPGLPAVMLCHGSPGSVNEKLVPETVFTRPALENTDAALILCGHSHLRGEIAHAGRRAINPGSAGIAVGCGKAEYLLLRGENGAWHTDFHQIPYDADLALAELDSEGLYTIAPYWTQATAALLRGGTVFQSRVLKRAMALCEEACGTCVWPDIPEAYWAKTWAALKDEGRL